MFEDDIDIGRLSRNYKEQPWRNGEEPNKDDFAYLYFELNLPAKDICSFMGIKSGCLSRTLRALGMTKDRKLAKAVRQRCNMATFGSTSPFGNKDVYKKGEETLLAKYGAKSAACKDIKNYENLNESYWRENFLKNGLFLSKECAKYHSITLNTVNNYKERFSIHEPNKIVFQMENEMAEFLNSLNIKFLKNERTLLDGLELDFYIPEYNIGIEIDGLLFHGSGYSVKGINIPEDGGEKQMKKPNLCRSKGILLLKIFEDEWKDSTKCRVWKSIIKGLIGMNRPVDPKHTLACEIPDYIAYSFLEEHSIEPYSALINKAYGVFYKGELVHVIGLTDVSECYQDNREHYSVIHSIDKRGWSVAQPISTFINTFGDVDVSGIVVNRRYPILEDLQDYDFEFHHDTKPTTFYFKRHDITKISELHISQEFLNSLPNQVPCETEWELLKANGYLKIYDSGYEIYKRVTIHE